MKIKYTLFFLVLLCASATLKGQGILFSEYRMIIDTKQVYTLQVCNPTQIVRAYKIQLEDKQMNMHGNIESLTDTLPFAQSLKRQIRVYPKRITLDPGECQTIQIQLKKILEA